MHEMLHAATAHLNAGRHAEAREILDAFVAAHASDPDALHLAGVARLGTRDAAGALALFDRALAIRDDVAEVHNNRGLALRAVGRAKDAEGAARRAVELDGGRREFHNNLGTVCEELGRTEDALASYRRALGLDPKHAIAHFNAGRVLAALSREDEAIESLRRATQLDAARVDAWLALGRVLTRKGDTDAARTALRRALMLAPANAEIEEAFADASHVAGRLPEAAAHYRRAVELAPDRGDAWFSLGCALLTHGDVAGALGALGHAVEHRPRRADAHYQHGKVAFELGQTDTALRSMERAVQLDNGEVRALALVSLATFIPGAPAATAQDVRTVREAWARSACPPATTARAGLRRRAGRLRVGYVSAFFAQQRLMKPVRALLDAHDRSRVEVHLFSDAPRSAVGESLRTAQGDHFHETEALDDESLARHIREAGIDVLVDLNAYSKPSRLRVFAHDPAPVGVTWFNNYATLAVPGIGWSVGDGIVAPPDEDDDYAEEIIRVDGTYLPFGVQYAVPDVAPPPVAQAGTLTFGSPASLYKLTPQVFDTWAQMLTEAPGARLLLRNAGLATRTNRDAVAAAFAARGVDGTRLSLEGPATHAEFLGTYDRIDVALDPFPYNGGTTTMEALWQGVPVLTFTGDRWASRISASILTAAWLREFVADDVAGYVRLAAEIAGAADVAADLAERRHGMRARLTASPAMDARAFAGQMENVYDRLAR